MTAPNSADELLASYRKVAAEAAKKTDLVKAAKGPRAIATASEVAAKAVRRRNVLAAQLAQLGVAVPDIG